MLQMLQVGLGGAIGAIFRYGVSSCPIKTTFPVLTLLINFAGAIFIGFLAGLACNGRITAGASLFWKMGVCGGFTTFSTFSLEAYQLLQRGNGFLGILYMVSSVALCLIGVALGQWLATIFFKA